MDPGRLVERVRGRVGLGLVVWSLAVLATPDTFAAAPAAAGPSGTDDNTSLEEVIVTGTSIKRINAETALPVQILKQEDIARTGATSIPELFHQISSAASFGSTVAA